MAVAVAIICFGSLINFHQYKIWGKPLIPSFIGYKRDVEKYSRAVSFSTPTNDGPENPGSPAFDAVVPGITAAVPASCAGTWFYVSERTSLPFTLRIHSSGLRGPPVC